MKTLHTRILRAMPDCHEATNASWRQVHGRTLHVRERLALESHLLVCPSCRTHRRHLKWLHHGVENLTPDTAGQTK